MDEKHNPQEEMKAALDKVAEMTRQAHVDAVFGKPQQIGDRTVIPVASVSYGFGMGYSTGDEEAPVEDEACKEESGEGGGAGGGSMARPVAFIEIDAEGTHVEPIVDEQMVAMAGILLTAWIVGWVGLVIKFLSRR